MVSSSLVWYLCCLSWSDNLACASLISSCRFRFSSCNPLIFRSSPALSVRAFSWISLISFARDSLLCVARLLADSAAYIQCQNNSRTTSTSELTCAFLKSASAFNCKSRSSFSCRSPTKSLSCLMFSSSYFRVFSCTRSSSFSGSNQVSLLSYLQSASEAIGPCFAGRDERKDCRRTLWDAPRGDAGASGIELKDCRPLLLEFIYRWSVFVH